MSDDLIPDEAVAAAARVFFGGAYGAVGEEGNAVLHDGAREALEAALPHLRAHQTRLDRDALLEALANIPVSYSHTLLTHNATAGRLAPHAKGLIADAVLALFDGSGS